MQVRLVQLLSDGVRRPREQCKADAGVFGTLTLELVTQNVADNRPRRMASIWDQYGMSGKRPLLPTLIDAELLRITPKGLWLRGVQFNTTSGECIQYAQEWWCEVHSICGARCTASAQLGIAVNRALR